MNWLQSKTNRVPGPLASAESAATTAALAISATAATPASAVESPTATGPLGLRTSFIDIEVP